MGRPFVTSEPDFACYGPYCANYLEAITLVTEQMPVLMVGSQLHLAPFHANMVCSEGRTCPMTTSPVWSLRANCRLS